MEFLKGINELLFPQRCLGCSSLSIGLCSQCCLSWKFSHLQTHANTISVCSAIPYTLIASNILLSAKEDGIEQADDLLVDAIRHALSFAVRTSDIDPVLIPIPSTARAIRRRGRNFMVEITNRVGVIEDRPVRNILRHNRVVQDQSVLSARDRFKNLSGALSVASRAGRGEEVFLIDDLITTGSTLNEAKRVLTIAGFAVLGAITACVSLPLR